MSDFAAFARAVNRRFAELEAENEQLRRRLDNVFREGRVTAVDGTAGTAEVDMNGLPSDKLSWSARAGSSKEWDPPAVGERVLVANPSGEPGLGIILAGGFSDDNPQNHDKAGEYRRSLGGNSVLMTQDKIVYSTGEATITIDKSGAATISAKSITLDGKVSMPKGFTAKAGAGSNIAGVVEGELHTTGDISSQTKVQAPVLQGTLQDA